MFSISFGRFPVFGPSWHGRCNMSCEPHEKLTNQPKPTLRRIIMLTIKDLAVSKSLDSKEMSAVMGGSAAFSLIDQHNSNGGFSFASPQTNVATPTLVNVDTKNIAKTNTLSNVGGQLLAGFF
jgi:hypothetical protein